MHRIHYGQLYLAPPNDSPYAAPPAPQLPVAPPPDPGPGQPVDPPAPEAPPNGDPPPAPAPATAQALQSGIETALAPIQAELTALRTENAAMRESQPAPAAVPEGEEDFTQQLLTNPREAVSGVVKEVVGQLAPFLNEISGTAHAAIVESHRAAVDEEFGPQTFQQEFLPILEKRFEQAQRENPTLLASRDWVNNEVLGVKGFKLNNLVERRGKAGEAKVEAEKVETERLLSQFNTGNLTGGVRPASSKSREPTPDEQAYIASCAEGGHKVEVETLRKSTEAGSTLSGLEAAFKKEDK